MSGGVDLCHRQGRSWRDKDLTMYVFIAEGNEWGESDGCAVVTTEAYEWLGDLPDVDPAARQTYAEDIEEAVAQALGGKPDMYEATYLGRGIWQVSE